MAYYKRGPPGKRGIGFSGFSMSSKEEQPKLPSNPDFTKHSSSSHSSAHQKPHKPTSEPRSLTKISDEDYAEVRRYEESQRRRRSRSPRRRSRSPRRRSRSPRRRSRSRSPRRRSRSRSPRRRSRSRSPRRRSRSPRPRSRSPRRNSPPRQSPSTEEPIRGFSEAPAAAPRGFTEAPAIPTFQECSDTAPERAPRYSKPNRALASGKDDQDDEDELLEYAERQAREEEEEEEEDPLDAFMAGLSNELEMDKKKPKKEAPDDRGKRCDIDEEDDQESYFKAMEENPNFVSPEDEEEMDVEYDDDGNPIYTPKKKVIIPLEPIDHSTIKYEPFGKDFYTEHSEISQLSPIQVVELRSKLGIKVSGFNAPKPVSSFAHFGFDQQTIATIRKQEYTRPTPIQAQSIPAALSGRDIIGIARTGSGKTASYVWPMIPHIMDQEELAPGQGPIAIVLAPTRELCIQIHQECKRFCKAFSIRIVCAYGGGNMHEQERALAAQCEVVVATPGRLIDHIKKKRLPMDRVTYLVLDECDRMFDLGFEPQVTSIVQRCRPDRQLLLFSATMRNKINRLCRKYLQNPIHIQEAQGAGSANQDVTQICHTFTGPEDKLRWLLTRLVEFTSTGSVLVFVTRKVSSEELAGKLRRSDYNLGLLHGDMSQYERNEVLTSFKKQEFRVLVATDVAARGLDIREIRTVVNFDPARDIDTHTHRVGRTGRAGEKGTAYSLLTRKDASFCGELVKHLEMAGQEVTQGVLDLANQDPKFRQGRNNPTKGFGRSDQKLRPGLGSGTSTPAVAGPMSARHQLGGMNALAGSFTAAGGNRAAEIKSSMKSNYMSRFTKASSTVQKAFQPEDKTFVKPSSSLYAGFAKASTEAPKTSTPLVTPAKSQQFVAPPPPPPPPPKNKKSRWQ